MEVVKQCPKCGKTMSEAESLMSRFGGRVWLRPKKAIAIWNYHKIIPFYCEACGYIELYFEK